MANNKLKILGVGLSTLTKQEILAEIRYFLEDEKPHIIVTPNPEFLLATEKDEEFARILNHADLAVPDGIGLKFAAWALAKNLHIYHGSDLVKDLLKIAVQDEFKVAIINWEKGLSTQEEIRAAVAEKYPRLSLMVIDAPRGEHESALEQLAQFKPDILLVGLGAPYQEKLIWHLVRNRESLYLKVALGVGGSFDFLTGKVKRAPRIFNSLGLEWLWRLLQQPNKKRWQRIANAVVIFPLRFIRYHFLGNFFYRPNVAAFLYKDDQVLLLNDSHPDDYWSLPQGGIMKGERPLEAIKREMREEIGNDNFTVMAEYPNLYYYLWPKHYQSKFKGQKQTLFILRFHGQLDDIILSHEHHDYKWVTIDNLIKEADPVHERQYKLFLEKYYETKKIPVLR